MEYVVLILVLFLLTLPIISLWDKRRQRYLNYLESEIETKEEYLISLDDRIHNTSLDRGTGLSYKQIEVLDKYERSNIRIPADILEELPYLTKLDEDETLEYIEQQRQHWKLENGKKVFKK